MGDQLRTVVAMNIEGFQGGASVQSFYLADGDLSRFHGVRIDGEGPREIQRDLCEVLYNVVRNGASTTYQLRPDVVELTRAAVAEEHVRNGAKLIMCAFASNPAPCLV